MVGERARWRPCTASGSSRPAPTLAAAIAGYLATLDHPETAATRRVYAGTPGRVVRHARC
jgi:hypothetical protein